MDRKQLGREKLGTPVADVFETLADVLRERGWDDLKREPISYYHSRMLGNWLLQMLDHALSDEQLHAVAPQEVTILVLLLFRDMFRHNADLLRPGHPDTSWIDPLFLDVASRLHVPPERLRDDGQPYDLHDMQNCGWARKLSLPFGMMAEKLFVAHSAIVTGSRDEAQERQSSRPEGSAPKSYEEILALIQQRQQEGMAPEAIRAELEGLGLSPENAQAMVAEPAAAQQQLQWLLILPLLALFPILIVLAVALERAHFAILLSAIGLLLTVLGFFGMMGYKPVWQPLVVMGVGVGVLMLGRAIHPEAVDAYMKALPDPRKRRAEASPPEKPIAQVSCGFVPVWNAHPPATDG